MQNLSLSLLSPPEPFQILVIHLPGNGIADPKELAGVSLPERVDHQKGLILYGRGPIWLYAYLIHLSHPSRWAAIYDPRFGGIVVQAHHPEAPSVGAIIPRESIERYVPRQTESALTKRSAAESPRHRVIAIVGPPHSGKSVFLWWLYNTLSKRVPAAVFHDQVFIVRACPDGEGNWFHEISGSNETLRFKNQWDADFVAKIVEHIRGLSLAKVLLLVDCGGKIDRFNQAILNACTDALIVSREDEAIAEWRGVAKSCELRIIAEVKSILEPGSSVLSESPLRLRIGGLIRGASPGELPEPLIAHVISVVNP
ncbi:CRISPR-associated ring nuclease Crn3/Csx3 [Methylacidimicrobium sp. B4]|uniref:CRISPR-associated ring nuclease Crn3/Csx3 n=1 Tax=Methylacidimicrobium sp. B4 TaxID=2796139 RepID=UPI001A8C41CD|nr:CRISPR-associated ring nuclease Crn3/Csx3 [Methylacidimicrobium sp. B4]QSR84643.1 CRISPR-associated protein Csx3 [Methylacidimicrobium sp. B4]